MGQNTKALLQFVIVVSLFGAIIAWAMPLQGMWWLLRIGFPVVGLAMIPLLYWGSYREDLFPDQLRSIDSGLACLESDGLSFKIGVGAADGRCHILVHFQNRYSNPCHCQLFLDPPPRSFWFGRLPMAPTKFEIDCGGAEFGMARIAYPVPAAFQGKRVTFDVGARTKYPQGRGQLLRFRQGLRVGPRKGAGSAILSVAAACVGIIYFSRPARVSLLLPSGVADSGSGENQYSEILWRPETIGHGFPVDARKRTAA